MKKVIYLTFGVMLLNTSGVHGSATALNNTDTSREPAASVVVEAVHQAPIDAKTLNTVMSIRNLDEARKQCDMVTTFLEALAGNHLINLVRKDDLISHLASENLPPERQTNLDWELQEVLNYAPREWGIPQYLVSPTKVPVKISNTSSRDHRGEGLRIKAFLAFLEKKYRISDSIRKTLEQENVFKCLFGSGAIHGIEMWNLYQKVMEQLRPLLANKTYQDAFATYIRRQAAGDDGTETFTSTTLTAKPTKISVLKERQIYLNTRLKALKMRLMNPPFRSHVLRRADQKQTLRAIRNVREQLKDLKRNR